MDLMQAMQERHSVRKYVDHPIEPEKVAALTEELNRINKVSGLRVQLFTEEPEAFAAGKTHYGMFTGCRNYFALVGPKGREEAVGYYGEHMVLFAQQLGLNTCWVAMTYRKGKVAPEIPEGEKLYMVIALGYGANQGFPHKNKPLEKLCEIRPDTPQWFKDGMQAVLLAPTAVNQQQFYFTESNGIVTAKAKVGFNNRVDLGIVKYHFEAGSGHKL